MRTTMMVMTFAAALGLAACGPDGSGGGLAAAPRADAGTADGGRTDSMNGLLGLWRYTAGVVQGTCSDGSPITGSSTGTETFAAGPQSNVLIATDDHGCTETCTVNGTVLRCTGDDTCKGVLVISDEFTLSGDTLLETSTGRVTLEDGSTCDVSLSQGTLARAR